MVHDGINRLEGKITLLFLGEEGSPAEKSHERFDLRLGNPLVCKLRNDLFLADFFQRIKDAGDRRGHRGCDPALPNGAFENTAIV